MTTEEKSPSVSPENELSDRTKNAMAWAHFIGRTWYDHFNNSSNRCEFLSSNEKMPNILSCVYCFGGATRDYVLQLPVNDLDCGINTNKLDLLFKDHLEKYHSKKKESQASNVKCILWRLYRNKKFNRKLDAKYLISILYNSTLLNNNVEYYENVFNGVPLYHIIVLKDVKYQNYNFKNQRLDFSNVFKPSIDEEVNTLADYADARSSLKQKKKELMKQMESLDDEFDEDKDGDGLIDINVNVVDITLEERFAGNDLSLNSILMFFDRLIDTTNLDKIDYNWTNCLFADINNKLYNNGINDIKNKILNTPTKDSMTGLKYGYDKKNGCSTFFRLLKFKARYGKDWTIPKDLINNLIKFNKVWLNDERFSDDARREKFLYFMFDKYIKDPIKYHPIRFEVMDQIEFHKNVLNYYKNDKFAQFKKDFDSKVQSKENEEKELLNKLLKQYGYV